MLGLLAIIAWICFNASPASAENKNLFLITVDTLRADYVSCNGGKIPTPNIDRLANDGVNFAQARTPVPLTLPAHASIFTALNPPAHGVRDNGAFALHARHQTLAEELKKRGYSTAAFVASFVLDARFGLAQGFDLYDDRAWTRAEMLERTESERIAGAVFEAFEKWLQAQNSKQPLFVWIHLYDPHAPYEAPNRFRNRFPKDPYGAEVAYTDFVVGRILKLLEERKMLSSGVVALAGDHGEGLGEHEEATHSLLIYNSTLHVPMLIYAPGLISRPAKIDSLTRTIDLAPTLLDLLGFPSRFGEGVSLRPWIENKKSSDLPAYSESLYANLNLGWSELYGLEDGNYHYIESPAPELFDVKKDPGEKQNVAGAHQQIVKKMSAGLVPPQKREAQENISEMDPEVRERLSSLGYVSGSASPKSSSGNLPDPKSKMTIWNQIQLGLFLYMEGKYADAAAAFRKVIAADSKIPLVYDYLGNALMKLRQWEEAEKNFREAIRRGFATSQFHANLGILYMEQQQPDRAEQALKQAVAMDTRNVTAHYYLGNVYRARKQFEPAVESYQRALAINPDYVYARNGLGMALSSMNRNDEALQAFQRAVETDPQAAPGYFNLAVQLQKMDRRKDALEAYHKFVSLANDPALAEQRRRALSAIRALEPTADEH